MKQREMHREQSGRVYYMKQSSPNTNWTLRIRHPDGRDVKFGVMNAAGKYVRVSRKRETHMYRKLKSYGFAAWFIDNATVYDHIVLTDEHGQYKIPMADIRKCQMACEPSDEWQYHMSIKQIEFYNINQLKINF